ncbi:hypothetical protein [Paractinoplanes maris]|uniref:hypothetical protein n=1 Tax=Paractinoplanes maris TaxID=1734446 RepID=UPI0020201376|nr:hypothetical protein [Actinoplanes maris]
MRTPLQGGLPPAGAVAGPVVEIACDESGFSGTNLLDPASPMITHASVDLSTEEAGRLIAELRSTRFSAHELKSGPFLRGPRAAEALEYFLVALRGRALVHLVDKEFFLVTRIVDLLLAEPSYAAGTRLTRDQRPAALALYRAGRTTGSEWTGFLTAFIDLLRTKRRQPPEQAVARFLQARNALSELADNTVSDRAGNAVSDRAGNALSDGTGNALSDQSRFAMDKLDKVDAAEVFELVRRLDSDDPVVPPPLEPLLPALAETVLTWSGARRRVLVTHDEQSALTADRLTRLQQALAVDGVSPLAGLIMVDSRDDPRVQLADLLAGVARRLPDSVGLRPLTSRTSLIPALW